MNAHVFRLVLLLFLSETSAFAAEIAGVTVTPHITEPSIRYRKPRDPELAAKVQLFVKGPALPGTFNGKTPKQLLESNEWSWHDLATAVSPPEGALAVWTFNGKSSRWGTGQEFQIEASGLERSSVPIRKPDHWIAAATFLSSDGQLNPDVVVLHIANDTDKELEISSLQFWLPKQPASWQTLWPREIYPAKVVIPARDQGFVKLKLKNRLPLTYAALELGTSAGALWEHLRIKREVFDISGGWIGDHLTREPYLRLLTHLHINTGHFQQVPGYTDKPELYQRYPLKLFHKLWPLHEWDTDTWLPRIHAVEFLGEPQYGGGRPVAPQEIFDQLLPYRTSRLATTITHSEERIWRYYAGLSDYPHYDAYRVVAPAADSWRDYDRWNGKRISWGAPLETIGDLSRSLRELNRPMPCAYWSQGPHDGWGGGFSLSGRSRRSPTPDELRSQAMHALSTRITSLYWFNLSLKSLLKYPDTWEAITRIGREIRMLEPFYLEGNSYRFQRLLTSDGKPDWDLASIAAPSAALLFANDLSYQADEKDNIFVFGKPRPVIFRYVLPSWVREPEDVFRIDADGIHEVIWRIADRDVIIEDTGSRDAIYVAAQSRTTRLEIEQRRQAALATEQAHPIDRAALQELFK